MKLRVPRDGAALDKKTYCTVGERALHGVGAVSMSGVVESVETIFGARGSGSAEIVLEAVVGRLLQVPQHALERGDVHVPRVVHVLAVLAHDEGQIRTRPADKVDERPQ